MNKPTIRRGFRSIFAVCFFVLMTCNVSAQFKMPRFGKGLSFVAKDSTFKLKFNARIQSLFVVEYDAANKDSSISNTSSNFMIRRARIKFGGYAFSPKIAYKIELGLSANDISSSQEDGLGGDAARIILDAVVQWKFAKNYELWVGQTKLPGNRERIISSASLQLVDRSLVNSRFNIDRDMGLQLRGKWTFGNFVVKPALAFTQGEGRNITAGNFGGFSYTARLDFNPFGEFAKKGDYIGGDLTREDKPKLAFAIAGNYNDRAIRQGGQLGAFVKDTLGNYIENSLASCLIDLMFKYKGFSIHSEFGYRVALNQFDATTKKFNTGYGFNVQMGYLFMKNYELAARFTMIRKDGAYSGLKNINEYTLGFSKYIVGHNLKVQTDLGYAHDPIEPLGVFRFRLQVEMQF
ncbi:OprO/OprP family phosphate-selective porin [Aureispira anguillae]|uniref:OprO/OprP family phosphate-selective porin n=1 Tax=Aureispira anguillae TaxID=2864201 RepID=A0A915YB26_9BACT|nr:OprO/OprP family phosphate-selective porin [Aureispira anguillae]BDS09802.1 OprO/OprP family phosphate-selective porin [Aureispira anguillae]